MDEELKKIIDDADTSNEDKITAIKNFVGNSYVPREKYNSLKENDTKAYSTLKSEFDAYKQSKMTDEEKLEAEKQEQLNKITEANQKIATLSAEKVFSGAGLKPEEYQDFLGNVSTMSQDEATSFATKLTTLIVNKKQETAQKVTTDIMQGTPTPTVNSQVSSQSELDTLTENVKKARESGNSVEIAKSLMELNAYQEKQKK